jgi:hypothetical protein
LIFKFKCFVGDKSAEKKTSEEDERKEKKKKDNRPTGKELHYQVLKKLQAVVDGGRRVVLVFDAVNRLVGGKISKVGVCLLQRVSGNLA